MRVERETIVLGNMEANTKGEEDNDEDERDAKYVISVGRRRALSQPVNCHHSREGCYRGRRAQR